MYITQVTLEKYTSFIKKDQRFIWFILVYIVVIGVHIFLLIWIVILA